MILRVLIFVALGHHFISAGLQWPSMGPLEQNLTNFDIFSSHGMKNYEMEALTDIFKKVKNRDARGAASDPTSPGVRLFDTPANMKSPKFSNGIDLLANGVSDNTNYRNTRGALVTVNNSFKKMTAGATTFKPKQLEKSGWPITTPHSEYLKKSDILQQTTELSYLYETITDKRPRQPRLFTASFFRRTKLPYFNKSGTGWPSRQPRSVTNSSFLEPTTNLPYFFKKETGFPCKQPRMKLPSSDLAKLMCPKNSLTGVPPRQPPFLIELLCQTTTKRPFPKEEMSMTTENSKPLQKSGTNTTEYTSLPENVNLLKKSEMPVITRKPDIDTHPLEPDTQHELPIDVRKIQNADGSKRPARMIPKLIITNRGVDPVVSKVAERCN